MALLLLRSSLWSCLPEELVMEVFNRLPDKELLGLRCVSKKYYSLITKSLCPKLAAISGFVFQWKPTKDKKDDNGWNYCYVTSSGSFAPFGGDLVKSYLSLLPFNPKRRDFVGCFNGFFLVRRSEPSYSSANSQYFVCNPATRQCVSVPVNTKQYTKKYRDWFVRLAFDPLLDTDEQGHYHFKLVQISRDNKCKGLPFIFDVYSSDMGKWCSYPVALDPKTIKFAKKMYKHSVYANGVFYMLSLAGYLLCFDILAIDNNNNNNNNNNNKNNNNSFSKARAIKLPHTSKSRQLDLFEASRGCLYYTCVIDDCELFVWTFQVNEVASPWILKYNISFSELVPTSQILAVDLADEIIHIGWFTRTSSYDIKNKQRRKSAALKIEGVNSISSTRFSAYSCCLLKLADHYSQKGQFQS